MRASRRDMQDVVLVEESSDANPPAETGADPAAQTGEAPEPSGRSRRAWRRTRWWWIAGVGLALVVLSSNLVTVARDAALTRALADVPGVLAPLDSPPVELWRRDSSWPTTLAGFGGQLLSDENHFDTGAFDVVATDVDTGRDSWRVAVRPADVSPGTDALVGMGGTTCAFTTLPKPKDGGAQAGVVACLVEDESVLVGDDTVGQSSYPTKAHLLLIDASTGTVRSSAPTNPSTAISFLGSDLLTGWVEPDGRVRVTRAIGLGPKARWTFTSADPVGTDMFGHVRVRVLAVGDLVVVDAMSYDMTSSNEQVSSGSSWVLASDDGAVVRTATADPSGAFSGGIGVERGGQLLIESATTGAGSTGMKVTDVRTGRSFTADAYPAGVSPDDGSLADVVLMQSIDGGGLIAYDLSSGKPRWTFDDASGSGGWAYSVIVLDGHVIRIGADGLTSIDGRTGDAVWTAKFTPTDSSSLVTDGRVAAVVQQGPNGTAVLAAYGLDDGKRRWQTAVDRDVWLIEIDGRLYGRTGDSLIALG